MREVTEVRIDGAPLARGTWVLHSAGGWVALAAPPAAGTEIAVMFRYSQELDLGCTDWNSTKGNYLFLNTHTPVSAPETMSPGSRLVAAPNPLRQRTVFHYRGEGAASAQLAVYDLRGRRVRALPVGALAGGLRSWEWNARDEGHRRVAAGVYFARFVADGRATSFKLVVLESARPNGYSTTQAAPANSPPFAHAALLAQANR